MSQFKVGDRVWILVAGDRCPAIVTDPEQKRRELPTRKRGILQVPDSIVTISYRMPPGQAPFYTERPENAAWVMPRDEHIAVIDSQIPDVPADRLIPALRR